MQFDATSPTMKKMKQVAAPRIHAVSALAIVCIFSLAYACSDSALTGSGRVVSDAGIGYEASIAIDSGLIVQCERTEAECMGACAAISTTDTNCGAGSCATACKDGAHCVEGSCTKSKIEHVVLIVQENHTFDNYFGKYCQAIAGTNPTCTSGRGCCEGAPKIGGNYALKNGVIAQALTNASNLSGDHDHDQVCELQQINGGLMDKFVSGATGGSTCFGFGPNCSDPSNWALADGATAASPVREYWNMADNGALADRYFQPMIGGSAGNDVYFAGARFRFVDNEAIPDVLVGNSTAVNDRMCNDESAPDACVDEKRALYAAPTIADLLLDNGKGIAVYAEGYSASAAAQLGSNKCPDPADAVDCPYQDCGLTAFPVACHACVYDPSDIPFVYFKRFADTKNAAGKVTPTPYMKDYRSLKLDLDNRTLPSFSFVKALTARSEHPNVSNITDGVQFVKATVDAVLASPDYKDNTLILLTWDEGGGYYDHVPPPKAVPQSVDSDRLGKAVPYGTRVPFLALGPFAKKGAVSHVVLEHSSVVRFLEWNFLTSTGQLDARDAVVNNLGSLLDASKTGLVVP
jgi:phospholipase C